MTEIEDTARAKKMPVSRSSTMRSGPTGTTTKSRKVEIRTTRGARAKTQRSDFSGKMSSFWRNFRPSARSCSVPKGPASMGPRRLCMKLIIFIRNT
jgi:hypothetical protein